MKPSLDLTVEIEQRSGRTYRLDSLAPTASDRPFGLTFGTKLMEGFGPGKLSLARRITSSWPDLRPYDTVRFLGADGDVAYEGRHQRTTASNEGGQRIDVNAVGWMAHMHDKKIVFLGIDSDMSSWGGPTAARDAVIAAAGFTPKGAGTVAWDKSLVQAFDGTWIAGELPLCEAWFDGGPGQGIGFVYYEATPGVNTSEADPTFIFLVYAASDVTGGGGVSTGNLSGAPANAGYYTVPSTGLRYAFTQFGNVGAGGVADTNYRLDWDRLVVYGDHGLERIGASDPQGLRGSDLLKRVVALGAPLLDTSGVLPTTEPVDQFVFRKATATYEMALRLNAPEYRNLAVWEGRKLEWAPLDTARTDWQALLEEGAKVTFEGASTEGSANGVSVSFQNILTGQEDLIDPTTDSTLGDDNPNLAANKAGLDVWPAIQLSDPQSPTTAARIGRAVLGEYNRQKYPARVVIRGHVHDERGNWREGWRPRAGQTLVLQDYDDGPPRLIHETSWDQDTKTLRLNLDADAATIDALIAKHQAKR